MADIICIECNAAVSDDSGYCPECGYPFDTPTVEQKEPASSDIFADNNPDTILEPLLVEAIPGIDILQQTLDSIRGEIAELQRSTTEIRNEIDTKASISADSTRELLSAVTLKLDEIVLYNAKKEAEALAATAKETKKGLIAAFYKTLNSPDSMFEYMFYITVVQVIFVIVNLFLVAYIVTLVR